MNSARKRVLWMTLLLFGALVYAVLSNPEWRRFNPSEFVDSFRTFDWRWITVAATAIYLTLAVRAWRWRVLMRSVKPNAGLWNLFSATVIGFGAIGLMGRPGEFVRPYLVARKEQVPVSGQLAVWVLERTFDGLVVLASAGIALSMLRLSPENAGSAMSSLVHTLGVAIAVGTSTVIVMVVFFRSYYHDFAAWIAKRSRFLSVGKRAALERWLDVFGEGLAVIRDGRSMAQCFALSLLEWLVIAASYHAVLAACNCGLTFSFAETLIFMGVLVLASLIQLPGVGGGMQVAAVFLLTEFFGLGVELAGALAVLLWALSFLIVIPPAFLLLALEGLSWRSLRALGPEESGDPAATS